MILSQTEEKMLERLRGRDAFLRRWRWPLVILHSGLAIGSFWLLLKIVHFPDEPRGVKALVAAHFLTPVFVMMGFSCAWVGYMIANWNGNAKAVLLIRLLDEHCDPS